MNTCGGVRKSLYRGANAELWAAVACLHCVWDLWWGKEDLPFGDTKKAVWLGREGRDSYLKLSLNCALSPGWPFSTGCYQKSGCLGRVRMPLRTHLEAVNPHP